MKYFALLISILISLGAGALGSLSTQPFPVTWYDSLLKPALNPPSWVFGPVWTLLYILMGVAAYMVWRKGWGKSEVRVALGLFALQLVLNALWSILFFGFQNPAFACVEILVLLVAICINSFLFYKITPIAGYLMIPYCLWVSFATYLNLSIWLLN